MFCIKGYDIVMLNDVVDYYVIGFEQFDECTDALLKGGVTPMSSSDPNVNTLVRFMSNT